MSKKYRPPMPDPEDVAYLRKRLSALVSRMKNDYERYLKPLVLKMSKESREQVGEKVEELERRLSDIKKNGIKMDAVEYFTPAEVARKLHTLSRVVRQGAESGQIEGAIRGEKDWLIPETSIVPFGILIGKILPDEPLIEKFNRRLELLTQKYNDLIANYRNLASRVMEESYRKSKKKFLRQFSEEVGIDILKRLGENGLKEVFRQQVEECVNLIKSIPQTYFGDIQNMVYQSSVGTFEYEGGLQKAIQDLAHVTKERAKLIARDQTMKAVSTFNRLRLENIGFKCYIWRNSRDKRVAGHPNGIYDSDPNAKLSYKTISGKKFYIGEAGKDKNKYHGNHWDREGKYFFFQTPPPDGHPGMGINCRCYSEPVFLTEKEIEDLEKDLGKKKGFIR